MAGERCSTDCTHALQNLTMCTGCGSRYQPCSSWSMRRYERGTAALTAALTAAGTGNCEGSWAKPQTARAGPRARACKVAHLHQEQGQGSSGTYCLLAQAFQCGRRCASCSHAGSGIAGDLLLHARGAVAVHWARIVVLQGGAGGWEMSQILGGAEIGKAGWRSAWGNPYASNPRQPSLLPGRAVPFQLCQPLHPHAVGGTHVSLGG